MKFKYLIFLFSIIICFHPFSVLSQGGLEYQTNGRTFIEDSIFQFKIEVYHEKLEEKVRTFQSARDDRNDPNYDVNLKDYIVAGYCFVPVKSSSDWNSPRALKFHTKGLYGVLTLWKEDATSPNEVRFFINGDALEITDGMAILNRHAQNGTAPSGVLNLTDGSNDIKGNSIYLEKYANTDSIVYNTREFDLVYIDKLTVDSLSTSNRYYLNNNLKPNGERDTLGLVIRRSYSALDTNVIHPTNYSLTNFRSLIFRPLVPPVLPRTINSEAALAFDKGHECPPWWRNINAAETVGNFVIKEKRVYITREAALQYPFGETWFRNLVILLIIIIIIFLVYRFYLWTQQDQNLITGNRLKD